ncbi:MAG: hypothetical protein IPG95_00750 [Saprospiraceae bacterium]|nr:hypothetical protein [Saprospiraceae bacterium]
MNLKIWVQPNKRFDCNATERSTVWDGLNSKLDGGKWNALQMNSKWLFGCMEQPNSTKTILLEGVTSNNQRSF